MSIIIMSPRDISFEDAEKEIHEYIAKAGNRTVYISELAEELNIDMDLIAKIHDPRRVIPDMSDLEDF